MRNAKNKLEDMDFCIRKGIAVYCIPSLIARSGLKQDDVGKQLKVAQGTVSKWVGHEGAENHYIDSSMNSRLAPTMLQVLELSVLFQTSVPLMLAEVITREEQKPLLFDAEMLNKVKVLIQRLPDSMASTGPIDYKGSDHFEIISKLAGSRYLGFFASDVDNGIEHLILETAYPSRTASVPAFAHVVGKAENVYRCNIVSPPNQKHLYVYMRQDGGKNDRGLIIFQVDDDIQGSFKCGSGLCLSTDRKSGEKRLQWVALVRIGDNDNPATVNLEDHMAPSIQKALSSEATCLNSEDALFEKSPVVSKADAIIHPILQEPLPSPDGWHLDFSCLGDRQDMFYREAYRCQLEGLEFAGEWKSTHPEHL